VTTVSPAGLVLPASFLKGEVRVHTRTPRPEWIQALRAVSPISDQHSWLYLAWEPGDPWDAIERWMLYQVWPWARTPASVRAELDGPDPRSTGHYCGPRSLCACEMERRPDLWVGGQTALINQTEWRLSRELAALGHPGWARAWWVIQGEHGGHPRYYTPAEAALADLADLPSEPPVPGELAYAEPDARTWDAVQAADRVRQGAKLLERRVQDFVGEQRETALRVRRATFDMLQRASRHAVDAYGAGMRRELSAYRLGAFAYAPDDDEAAVRDPDFAREAFVQDID
jgi:hypothetical protein